MVNGESFSIHVPHTIPLKKGYLDNSSFPLSKRQALLAKTAIDRSTTDQIRARVVARTKAAQNDRKISCATREVMAVKNKPEEALHLSYL